MPIAIKFIYAGLEINDIRNNIYEIKVKYDLGCFSFINDIDFINYAYNEANRYLCSFPSDLEYKKKICLMAIDSFITILKEIRNEN